MTTKLDFEQDAASAPDAQQLQNIAALAQQQIELESAVQQAEAQLLQLQRRLRRVQEEELPQAMAAAGCVAYTLNNGASIKIEEGLTASLTAERRQAACEWLREHGFGDIVKEDVSVSFGKGEERQATDVALMLQHAGYVPTMTTNVNTATLKALLREQLSLGADVPLDLFGAYQWKKAKIKRATS